MKTKPPILEFKKQWEQENEEIKFDLYVQSRRAKQLHKTLSSIAHRAESEQNWLEANQDLVEGSLDQLLRDSLLALDGIEIDRESIDLSLELISNIKSAVGLIQNLVRAKDKIHQ